MSPPCFPSNSVLFTFTQKNAELITGCRVLMLLKKGSAYMLRMRLNFVIEDCFALNCTLRSLYNFEKKKESVTKTQGGGLLAFSDFEY